MLATDVLKNNHKAILDLFDRYRRTGRGDHGKRMELFRQIKRSVRTHLSLEEEMLYPAMIRRPSPDAGRRLDGVLREHLFIDDLLTSLSELRPQDRQFDVQLQALRRRVEEHLLLEEDGPYDEIRRALKRSALEKLGALIRARIDLLSRVALPLS
jgi:iron-sulfur cluster repair protein YtfE (RIC family)